MSIKDTLKSIALMYPENLVNSQLMDIDRIAFHIKLILDRKGNNITLLDVGGGIGLFSVGCSALGMNVMLIDDFRDPINYEVGNTVLEIHKKYGVNVIFKDIIKDQIDFESGSLDVVTTFDSMEHWHHSPKKIFHSIKLWLKHNGLFVLGVPNCVNLRKRLTIPFGYGKWTSMKEWYEKEEFRGHVREPDVDDLLYIAKDMDLKNVEILGRNLVSCRSDKRMVRFATIIFGYLLQLRPSLCGDIYMIGFA